MWKITYEQEDAPGIIFVEYEYGFISARINLLDLQQTPGVFNVKIKEM